MKKSIAMKANEIRVKKLQAIDTQIAAIMALEAQAKALSEQLKEAKAAFAGEYFTKDNAIAETISGLEYSMIKTPVLSKKEYNVDALAVLLTAANITPDSIIKTKTIQVVDEKELKKKIKSGKLLQATVDKVISGVQGYRMSTKHQ